MKLRTAEVADAEALAKVHVLSWQHAYRGLLPQDFLDGLSIERRQATWSSLFAKRETSTWIVEVDSRVIGFSTFGPCRDDGAQPSDWEIWAIYVAPDHWSTGAGRLLWLKSKEAIIAHGGNRISLWVIEGNERAIRFYTAAGFQPEDGRSKTTTIGGAQIREFRYVFPQAGA